MVDAPKQRALARTARTQKGYDLADADRQLQSPEHGLRAIVLVQILHLDRDIVAGDGRGALGALCARQETRGRHDLRLHGGLGGQWRFFGKLELCRQIDPTPREIVGEPSLARGAIEVEQPFQAKLDGADRARQQQIEQPGGEEDREEVEGRGRELRATQRQFLHRDHRGERRILQRADGFIAESRDHGADGLRRDHPAHQYGGRHAERLPCGHLPAIDTQHA